VMMDMLVKWLEGGLGDETQDKWKENRQIYSSHTKWSGEI
jgi:hypothetical protein